MTPFYIVRHLAGEFEELPCFRQLEDESAAMYFNIIHGAKLRRAIHHPGIGRSSARNYVLVARAGEPRLHRRTEICSIQWHRERSESITPPPRRSACGGATLTASLP